MSAFGWSHLNIRVMHRKWIPLRLKVSCLGILVRYLSWLKSVHIK